MRVDVQGLGRLRRRFHKLRAAGSPRAMRKSLEAGAQHTARAARDLAPVDSGTLARSVAAGQGRRRGSAVVVHLGARRGSPAAQYIHFVEGGTRYVRGRHFMARALRRSRRVIVRQVERDTARRIR